MFGCADTLEQHHEGSFRWAMRDSHPASQCGRMRLWHTTAMLLDYTLLPVELVIWSGKKVVFMISSSNGGGGGGARYQDVRKRRNRATLNGQEIVIEFVCRVTVGAITAVTAFLLLLLPSHVKASTRRQRVEPPQVVAGAAAAATC